MKKCCLIIVFSCLTLVSCIFSKGTISVNYKTPSIPLNISISNIQVINHQIVISGTRLNNVKELMISSEGSSQPIKIESKTTTSIVANVLSNVTFAAGKMMNLILSDANASATFTINFSLCDSTLNGAGFDCGISALDHDVLSYDQSTGKWKPRSINGLTYKGVFDASVSAPVSGGPSATGEYYVISVPGNGYTVGDWAVDNGTTMDKIDNSPSAVSSVFSRIGAVVGAEGDYGLDQLSDVTLGTPASGNVLKYNGTNWIAGTVTAMESDPSVSAFAKAVLPTCNAGEVLKGNGVSLSCVTDAGGAAFSGTANRAVVTNGSGALAVSAITDTVLSYLSGATSNIQTQLDSKASSVSIVDWSVHSAGGPYLYPTRIYGGALQTNKTLVTDVSGSVVTSAVTPTELSYLTGVTSGIQAQINAIVLPWTTSGANIYRASGKVGIGTATPVAPLDINNSSTATNGTVYGQNILVTHTPASSSIGVEVIGDYVTVQHSTNKSLNGMYGIISNANYNSTHVTASASTVEGAYVTATASGLGGTNELNGIEVASTYSASSVGNAYGINSKVTMSGIGTLGQLNGAYFKTEQTNATATSVNIYGIRSSVTNTNGSMTNTYGMHSEIIKAGGTVQNGYGLFIGDIQAFSPWSIYVSSTTAPSYFAGKVGLGVAVPTEVLDVVGNIKSSGCVYYASSSLGTCASDARIKKDIHPFQLGLEALLGIEPVNFKYNGLGGFNQDEKVQVGVVAQQIEKSAPSLVKRQLVQLHPGDDVKTEIKVVDYGSFTYVIINAIKQLHKKWFDDSQSLHQSIAELKAENELMKNKLTRLEKLLEKNKTVLK